jgi:hypothetical protein
MKRKIALTVVVALGALNSTSYAQSQDDIAKQFVGMWRLVSWPQRLADGTMRQNPLSVGYIIYTDTNHMCYVSMNPNRPKWNSARAPTESEALSGMGNTGFSAYCATVEIHANEGFVLHLACFADFGGCLGFHRQFSAIQSYPSIASRIKKPCESIVFI